MNRPVSHFLLLSIPVCALCLSAGCSKSSAPGEEEKKPPAPVKVVQARQAVIGEWTEVLGATEPLPDHFARLGAAVGGRVVALLGDGKTTALSEGQTVKKGQIIVRLDDRVAVANRDRAKAALDELREQVKQAELQTELANIDLNRLKQLVPKEATPASIPLVSQSELTKAGLLLKEAQSRQRGVIARQETASADLKSLQEQLDLYTLQAPLDGVLGTISVALGQTVAAGAPVADIINLDEVDVMCFVPPQIALRIAAKQPARLLAVAGQSVKDAPADGKVVFVAVAAQAETGNFVVKVRFPNKDRKLRANTVVRVHVLTQPEQSRLVVPEAALMEDQEPPSVFVAQDIKTKKNAEGHDEKFATARKFFVVTGIRDRHEHLVQIIRLEDEKHNAVPAANAVFVVEGGYGLHDGDALKLEEDEHKE